MLQIFQKLFQRPIRFVQAVLNPPQHIRLDTFGTSMHDCLHRLEKKADLPAGDLYIKGESMKVASWPLGLRSLRHSVGSKTSDMNEADVSKQGYVGGHVIEPLEVVISGSEYRFFGSLHISKNCPGVYRDNVCTTCGDVAP